MGTYPCSNCGATADTGTGCPSCGKTLLDEIGELNRTIVSMQVRNKGMVDDRTALQARLQGAIAIRTLLERAAGIERGTVAPTSRLSRITGRTRPMEVPTKRPVPPPRKDRRAAGTAARARPQADTPSPGTAGDAAAAPRTRRRTGVPPQPTGGVSGPPAGGGTGPRGRVRRGGGIPGPRDRAATPPPAEPRHPHHPPETTPRSMQNLVLGLGALVMAIAVGLTPFLYGSLAVGPRLAILCLLTAVALLVPIWYARRGLITTAEWLTPIGLLLVLLDGRELWSAGLRDAGVRPTLYAALVCLAAAGVSVGVQQLSILAVPRFAAIVLIQPVLALAAYPWLHDSASWATVLTATAAVDLIIGYRTHRSRGHGRYLRAAVRWLQAAVNAGALVYGGVALAHAHRLMPSVRAGAPVLAAAVVGLAAGLLFRQRPLPEISAGVATVAAVTGFGRMSALALPGWGLLATATAIAAVALGARLLPGYARRGAEIAGSAMAVLTALTVVVRGAGALAEPLRAATPAWSARLAEYPGDVAAHAGTGAGQLVVAVLLLTVAVAVLIRPGWRRETVVAGVVLATVLAPGAWHLPWAAAIVVTAAVALACGAFGLSAATTRQSWIGVASAVATGGYAAGLAAARPASFAVLLLIFTIGGAAIGAAGLIADDRAEPAALAAAPAPPPDPGAGPSDLDRAWSWLVTGAWRWLGGAPAGALDARMADAGWGAAALALPGSIAAATAALAPAGSASAEAILAATFVTVAGTLTAAAVCQVARRRPSPLLVGGASLGAVAAAVAALRTHGTATGDLTIALMLLFSAVVLCIAPVLGGGVPVRVSGGGRTTAGRRMLGLDGDELAAAAVTAASIAALGRVASLVVPGYGLVTPAFLVLVVAAWARSMPDHWRRGPVAGGVLVGIGVTIGAGYAALDAAVTVIRINHPLWHVPLDGWAHRLAAQTSAAAHGAQAPVALLLIAAAAVTVLRRNRVTAVVIAAGLTALVAPATLGTGWWGPGLFSGAVATAAGLLAARTVDRTTSLACAGVASVLFADTIAASLVAPGTTAATVLASAGVLALVADTAAGTLRRLVGGPHSAAHLILFGGGALASAVLAVGAAAACLAATVHRPQSTVLTAAMAGLGLSLGLVGNAAHRLAPLLVQVSAAISLGGLAIALVDIRTLSVAGVYASVAALFAVLAELIRTTVAEQGVRRGGPGSGWLPRRTAVLLAAGPAAALAVAGVLPTLMAALIGPYHTFGAVWRHAPASSLAGLGPSASLVGAPVGLVAAVLLTLTATIGAIGYPGSREAIVGRVVAVVTPGFAVTLLIAPYLLRAGWPGGPVAALTVATISGLALALTRQPPDGDGASALRASRRFVGVICLFAAAAAAAGSLATPAMTIGALAAGTAAGLVAAFGGRTQTARVCGWIVGTSALQLLALAVCLRLRVPGYDAAFAIGAVAAALLIVSALLPPLRGPERINETLTIEVGAYAGAVLALLLAVRSIPHLAVFLACWGAVLGMVAARQHRSRLYRSLLMWTAAGHELVAWCLLMAYTRVAVPEAYTLGIALVAMVTGWLELRWHPQLTSWVSYGVALTAALGPSLAITIATGETPLRRVLLLAAAAATTVFGAVRRQQAPVVIGGVALLGATSNEIARYSTTAVILVLMAIIAAVLIGVGANFEKRRRNLRSVWTRVSRMQ